MFQKLIFLFIILLFLTVDNFGQIPNDDLVKPIPSSEKDHFVTDSTWYSLGNAFGQTWFKNRVYRVKQLNDAGNVLSASDYEYDTLGLFWYEQRRYEAHFVNNTIRTSWLSYVYNQLANSWLLADSIHFNSNGQPLRSWYKEWNPINHAFEGGRLSEFIYNEEDLLHLTYNKYLDTLSGQWRRSNYEVIYYNQNDLDSIKQIYQWDASNGVWLDSLQKTYTYSSKFFPVEQLDQLWPGNILQNYKRWEYIYVDDLLDDEYEYNWNDFSKGWEYKDFSDYDYNPDQTLEKKTDYFWDGYEWYNKTRKSYTYNSQSQPVEILNEFWSFGFNQWSNSSLNTYDYDSNGNRDFFAFFIWDDYNLKWRNFYKEENFWSLFESQGIGNIAEINFEVFPNPTNDKVQISPGENMMNTSGNQLYIYSNEGRLELSKNLSGTIETIDVSSLPPGVYHFMIKTENGIGSRAVIKR